MKTLTTFGLTITTLATMLTIAALGQTGNQDGSDLRIIDFGWTQHVTGNLTNVNIVGGDTNAPVFRKVPRTSTVRQTVPEHLEQLERKRDTNARMSDLRSLDVLARASQTGNVNSGPPRPFYEYYVRVQNTGGKAVQSVYWQYEFQYADQQSSYNRQFFCKSKLKPDEIKDLRLYSYQAPSKVIRVSSDGASVIKSNDQIVINRIQFSDGSFWQRPGWKAELVSEELFKKLGSGQCTTSS